MTWRRHPALAAGLRSWWMHREFGDGRVRSAYCYARAAVAWERLYGSLRRLPLWGQRLTGSEGSP